MVCLPNRLLTPSKSTSKNTPYTSRIPLIPFLDNLHFDHFVKYFNLNEVDTFDEMVEMEIV